MVRGISTRRSGSSLISSASTRPLPRSRAPAFPCCGSVCRRSAAPRQARIPPISTRSIAAGRRRPASPMSISGTASSTRPAGSRRRGPDYEGQIRRLRAGRRRLFHQVRRAQARPLCRARDRAPHHQPWHASLPCRRRFDPGPQAPSAKPGGPAQRPVVGPVVPLTAPSAEREELIGGGPRRRSRTADRRHRCARADQGRADCRPERAGGRFQLAAAWQRGQRRADRGGSDPGERAGRGQGGGEVRRRAENRRRRMRRVNLRAGQAMMARLRRARPSRRSSAAPAPTPISSARRRRSSACSGNGASFP